MKNKKLGVIFLIISIVISIIILQFMNKLYTKSEDLGCFGDANCAPVESTLGLAHLAFGVIGFIFALGFYLIFFSKSEEAILKRLEEEKAKRSEEEKFELINRGLDPFEKKVINIVREQDGITQNTLRIKSDMSKAKLSYVVNDLERKDLIRREAKGKTFAIYAK